MAQANFYQVVQDAIADLAEHGYDSEIRLETWVRKLRDAANDFLVPDAQMEDYLRDALGSIYIRLVEKGAIAKYHPGVGRFTIDRLKPRLRRELDKRILASANLIKLSRETAVNDTLRRFQGWATSIPAGGQGPSDKADAKAGVKKALQSMPFIQRRVCIDQGTKLTASINNVIAVDGGAIALIWRSNWRQLNYNYRTDHKHRDGHCYAIRGSWALEKGLMKAGHDGYYDDITAVASEPFCRCFAVYVYTLGKLPADMITDKGRDELVRVKAQIAGM